MGETREKSGENPYIWLRYTTQFNTGGRMHTIEMGIPMPLGASAETREQLIREAEAGMDQLSRHVEHRVTQMLSRNARPQGQPIPSQGISLPPQIAPSSSRPSTSTPTPMPAGATPSSSPPAPVRNDMPPPASPPVRPNMNVGASMPLSPNVSGEAGGNIKLSQFMHYIREAWGLSPKQAMDLLNVKTLNGLNYREALKQLQPLVGGQNSTTPSAGNVRDIKSAPQVGTGSPVSTSPSTRPPGGTAQGNGSNATPSPPATAHPSVGPQPYAATEREATPRRDGKEAAQPPVGNTTPQVTFHPPDGTSRSQTSPSQQGSSKEVKEAPQTQSKASTPPSSTASSKIPIIPISSGMIRDTHQPYRFDEEDDSELELNELELEEQDDDTEQQQILARIKLDELKEVRGSSAASPGRLTVLQNLTSSQISETQLHQLIQAAWGVTSPKKLKVDQVEALISWAKEDLFVEEVEAVLALIAEEDSYARSDR